MTAPHPYIPLLLGLGAILLLVSWAPRGLKSVPVSLAMISVGLGFAVFKLGWLGVDPDPRLYDTITERLTELVIVISLMGAGLKLDRPIGWRAWASTWRLLGIAMPLTIVAVAVLGHVGLGFSLAMALLLGAAMAPTDPVLAADVQTGPPRSGEANEVRFGLTSEAGFNDALAFPFVNLAVVAATGHVTALRDFGVAELATWFAVDVVWKLVAGCVMGWVIGRAIGRLLFGVARDGISRQADGVMAVGATLIAYALTEVVHGYGFLAVFVCGLTIRAAEPEDDFHEEMHDFAEQIERLLMMLLLVMFGGALAIGLLDSLTWTMAAVGLAIVFVVRPVAGAIAMVGSPLHLRDRLLIAWFGIRGLGSVYYVAWALNHGPFGPSDRLWAVTGFIILVSIIAHGITATPLMRWLERMPALSTERRSERRV
jgi:NhaP-type Na+/H+ or K+/H+ antiporter